MGKPVELMPVNDEVTFAIRRGVNHALHQFHGAETHADKFFQKFVVIAVDQSDLRVLAILAQQFLDQNIVFLRPKPFATQLPAVDEIADDIEVLAFRIAQKIEKFADLSLFVLISRFAKFL